MCALFSSKSHHSSTPSLQLLQSDTHAHILPAIDDGPVDIDQATELVRRLSGLGLQRLHATPHVMADHYHNSRELILQRYDQLINVLAAEKVSVEIICAAEYFLDENFAILLDKEELLPLSEKYLLVEMSTVSPAPGLYDFLFEIQTHGYVPLLAHPERYVYYHQNFSLYEELKTRGCLFQVNLLSLGGYYGRKIKSIAWKMIKQEMVDFLGTDAHHLDHVRFIEKSIQSSKMAQLLGSYSFMNSQL